MNLPGLLIEYLINGAIALLWISRLINFESTEVFKDINVNGLVLIPVHM